MELISVYSGASQTIAANAVITPSAITHHRKAPCSCGQSFADSASITILKAGYYQIDGFVSFTSAAGTASVSVAKGGTILPSSTASLTAEAATGYTLPISAMVLVRSAEAPVAITFVNGATALSVSAISATAVKVA